MMTDTGEKVDFPGNEPNQDEPEEISNDEMLFISFNESEMKKMTITDNKNVYRFLSALEIKGQVDKILYTKAFKTKIQQKLGIKGVACGAGARYFPQTISVNMKCCHHKSIVCSVSKAKFVDGAAQKFSMNPHCGMCINEGENIKKENVDKTDDKTTKHLEMSMAENIEGNPGSHPLHKDLEVMFKLLRAEVKKHQGKGQQLLIFATHAAKLSFQAGYFKGQEDGNSPEYLEKEEENMNNVLNTSNLSKSPVHDDEYTKLQEKESSPESSSEEELNNEIKNFVTPIKKRRTCGKKLFEMERYTPTGKNSRQKKYLPKKTGQSSATKSFNSKKNAGKK